MFVCLMKRFVRWMIESKDEDEVDDRVLIQFGRKKSHDATVSTAVDKRIHLSTNKENQKEMKRSALANCCYANNHDFSIELRDTAEGEVGCTFVKINVF